MFFITFFFSYQDKDYKFLRSLSFFFINFLSTKGVFKVFSNSSVFKLIQAHNFQYCFFELLKNSIPIKLAKEVDRAVQLVNTTPMLGLNNDIEEVVFADPYATKNSVVFNVTFLFKLLYFSYIIHYQY